MSKEVCTCIISLIKRYLYLTHRHVLKGCASNFRYFSLNCKGWHNYLALNIMHSDTLENYNNNDLVVFDVNTLL